jgi:uncharacterized protein (DUF1697 family)
MKRYVAFLRAINVGGHTVTMEALRDLFRGLRLSNVETFIASGNVIFESKAAADRALEMKIETRLEKSLGYTVATFVRSIEEIREISVYKPFRSEAVESCLAYNVGFLQGPLSAPAVEALKVFRTEIDDFHVHGRELYWLSWQKQSESKITNRVLERAIQGSVTFRNVNTIARIAAKYPASAL